MMYTVWKGALRNVVSIVYIRYVECIVQFSINL